MKTLRGGEVMKELQTMCKYERDMREYCDRGVLGNVVVESFGYDEVYGINGDEGLAELIDNLQVLEECVIVEEPCDCWKYDRIMHNDGGNYHSRIRVYEITHAIC